MPPAAPGLNPWSRAPHAGNGLQHRGLSCRSADAALLSAVAAQAGHEVAQPVAALQHEGEVRLSVRINARAAVGLSGRHVPDDPLYSSCCSCREREAIGRDAGSTSANLRRRSVWQGAQRRGECHSAQHTDQHLTLAGVRSVADSRCIPKIADQRCCLADVPQRPWNAGLRLEGVREDGLSIEFACEQLDGPADGPCMIIAIMLPSVQQWSFRITQTRTQLTIGGVVFRRTEGPHVKTVPGLANSNRCHCAWLHMLLAHGTHASRASLVSSKTSISVHVCSCTSDVSIAWHCLTASLQAI